MVDVARRIAEAHRATIPQVTLAWLLAQPSVTTVILGAKRMSQLEDTLGSASLVLREEELASLSQVSEPPVEYPGWFLKEFDTV